MQVYYRDMKDNFTNFVDNIRVRFDKIKPSNEEFLAMIGLSLWSSGEHVIPYAKSLCLIEETELNENIVRKHRSRILSELHKLYANRGIEDYSSRLGEIFCLLESIEVRSVFEKFNRIANWSISENRWECRRRNFNDQFDEFYQSAWLKCSLILRIKSRLQYDFFLDFFFICIASNYYINPLVNKYPASSHFPQLNICEG